MCAHVFYFYQITTSYRAVTNALACMEEAKDDCDATADDASFVVQINVLFYEICSVILDIDFSATEVYDGGKSFNIIDLLRE